MDRCVDLAPSRAIFQARGRVQIGLMPFSVVGPNQLGAPACRLACPSKLAFATVLDLQHSPLASWWAAAAGAQQKLQV